MKKSLIGNFEVLGNRGNFVYAFSYWGGGTGLKAHPCGILVFLPGFSELFEHDQGPKKSTHFLCMGV